MVCSIWSFLYLRLCFFCNYYPFSHHFILHLLSLCGFPSGVISLPLGRMIFLVSIYNWFSFFFWCVIFVFVVAVIIIFCHSEVSIYFIVTIRVIHPCCYLLFPVVFILLFSLVLISFVLFISSSSLSTIIEVLGSVLCLVPSLYPDSKSGSK